ncbi:MAG: glycosyltransferase family 2 protein [Acidobacteria bacterium]|nr:glycosyltransferase family 2 protein [Acidobacteriota bacterium]
MSAAGPTTLSIVIPAFNEELRLARTLAAVSEYLRLQPWDWEIRVVDDGSTDATASVVEQCHRGTPRIVLEREPHRGKGGAVKAGMLAATSQFRFLCDADLSMPIRELEKFMPPRQTNFDVAIGTREGAGSRRVGEPLLRHLVGRLFNQAVKRLMFTGIEDTQCGFKMFTASAVEAVFPLVRIEGWAFDVEVLHIARRRGLRIVEVPIEWHYRRESQLSLIRDGARMLRDVLAIRMRSKRRGYD